MVLPFLLALCLTAIAVQALRKPVLRRLAIRDAVRRPGETMLVVAGSLLGTALITGSFIVGDTLDSSIRATAVTQLGPVDELVVVPSARVAEDLEQSIERSEGAPIDGVISFLGARAAIASESSTEKLAEPYAQMIEIDFAEAKVFGGDREGTGIRGHTPGIGEVAVTDDLAHALEVEPGERVTAYLYGKKLELRVTRTLPRLGLAGLWTGSTTQSMNAFVAPGTLNRLLDDRPPAGALPPLPSVAVSNRGDVYEGAELTDEVTKVIEDAFPADVSLRVHPAKQERLDGAEEQGDAFGELFLGIGSFAIIAGILLLVNIFVMLSEERKGQLGMLRAVGMRRSHLVRAFVIEGALYSLVASLLGAGLGIGVGWAIVKLAAPIFSGFDDFSLNLRFDIDPTSIVFGFCGGALISLLSVTFTSIRISRINIIRAIRDLPEPASTRSKNRTVIAGGVLTLVATAWFLVSLGESNAWTGAILGPPLVAFGLLPLLSRLLSRRVSVLAVAALAIVWGVFGNTILEGQFFQAGEIFAFVTQGILLTFAAVVLLSQSQETFEGAIRRVAASRLPLRLSIAYPLARRFRTGLTLGMFALVIFTMVFIATLTNVFGGQVDTATRKEGGFDILVTTNFSNPPASERIARRPGVERVATLLFGGVLFQPEGFPKPADWSMSGIDRAFVEGGPPSLSERGDEFDSDAEVWEALLDDPSAIVVPLSFLQTGGGPPQDVVETGETTRVINPLTGIEFERRVIGKVENDFAFSGSYVSKSSIRRVLGERAVPSRFYVEATGSREGINDTARRLQGRFVANGLEAKSFRTIVEEFQQVNLQFFRLMQSYLALGLLVGIAGLGVVMVRAVRERRRDIGVLRALGFLTQQVRRAFVLESGFVALEGVFVGVVLALVTSSQLVSSGEFGENVAFIVPWGQIAFLALAALIASLLATAWPAQQASRIPPAVALRISD